MAISQLAPPSATAEQAVLVALPLVLGGLLLWGRAALAEVKDGHQEGQIQLPTTEEDLISPSPSSQPTAPRFLLFSLLAAPGLSLLGESVAALLASGQVSVPAGLYLGVGAWVWSEWAIQAAKGLEGKRAVAALKAGTVVGILGEGALLGFKLWPFVSAHRPPTPLVLVLPTLRSLALSLLLAALVFPRLFCRPAPPLPAQGAPTSAEPDDPKENADDKDQLTLWPVFLRRLAELSPYLWPSDSARLQAASVACVLLMILGRVCNVWLPLALGSIIDDLSAGRTPTWAFTVYFSLSLLASSFGGIINFLHDMLWLPVSLHSENRMQKLCFDRLLALSMRWHAGKNTGATLSLLDQGSAITELFQTMLFDIGPTAIDLGSVLVVFHVKFGLRVAVMVVGLVVLNVIAATTTTDWRQTFLRGMMTQQATNRGIHTDVLANWEAVKCFTAERHESGRYEKGVGRASVFHYYLYFAWDIVQLAQTGIMIAGLLIGSIIVTRSILSGGASPGDFIVFITYIGQLTGPLDSLRGTYKRLSDMIVAAEKLLKLLNEELDVQDAPDAVPLRVSDGVISFEDVRFSYDPRRPALKGVSFTVPKGAKVALVGESGSGKSTILRLLFRFYDLDSGAIKIDGQDISKVTQESLRGIVGVVPQDAALFNESVRYNLEYGKIGATTAEIEAAAKSAQIHDRILSFPDGYASLVGERGVKVSGGEKQRLSIARALLKNPPILLLDEATSALDTNTEREIQTALNTLLKGRTSLTVAHRLSTIVRHDLIIVMAEGEIVETGSHKELLEKGGVFAQMWQRQIETDEEAKSDVPVDGKDE